MGRVTAIFANSYTGMDEYVLPVKCENLATKAQVPDSVPVIPGPSVKSRGSHCQMFAVPPSWPNLKKLMLPGGGERVGKCIPSFTANGSGSWHGHFEEEPSWRLTKFKICLACDPATLWLISVPGETFLFLQGDCVRGCQLH